jgi:hypothetical protein
MLKISYSCILLVWLAVSCSKQANENPLPEVPLSALPGYNMGILPNDHPTAADDIRLVIYNDCKYNRLVSMEKKGQEIDIVRQFNSMIMAPCVLTNDTIPVGKLGAGTYLFNYRLMDIAVPPGKMTFGISFRLTVAK